MRDSFLLPWLCPLCVDVGGVSHVDVGEYYYVMLRAKSREWEMMRCATITQVNLQSRFLIFSNRPRKKAATDTRLHWSMKLNGQQREKSVEIVVRIVEFEEK